MKPTWELQDSDENYRSDLADLSFRVPEVYTDPAVVISPGS